MWRTIALGLGCLGLTGCSGPSGGGGDGPAPAKDPLDVYEAVFRYRLQNHPRDVRAYLSVDGRDLPADLLRRLRRDWPNLAPASEEPKEKGLRLYVSELEVDRRQHGGGARRLLVPDEICRGRVLRGPPRREEGWAVGRGKCQQ